MKLSSVGLIAAMCSPVAVATRLNQAQPIIAARGNNTAFATSDSYNVSDVTMHEDLDKFVHDLSEMALATQNLYPQGSISIATMTNISRAVLRAAKLDAGTLDRMQRNMEKLVPHHGLFETAEAGRDLRCGPHHSDKGCKECMKGCAVTLGFWPLCFELSCSPDVGGPCCVFW